MRTLVLAVILALAPVAHAAEGTTAPRQDKAPLAQLLPHIPAVSPEASIATFKVAPGFKVELVAAEPNVADPVDVAWDENGRMFVCELWNYPGVPKQGEPLGRVRMLTSSKRDGIYDQSTIYADGLRWPSGVICWDGGVYVISNPDIWYLKDSRGDGKADVRRKVFTGLQGQTYEVANSLRWGPDNRIYVCGSYAGGNLRPVDAKEETVHSRDFRFDPRTNTCEPVSGDGEWGMCFNDWGDKFNCDATDLCYHTILPRDELARNPYLAVSSVQENSAGQWARVFPISPPEPWKVVRQQFWNRWVNSSNDFRPGRFPENELAPHGFATSACGLTAYRGSAFPAEYRNSLFIGEPANNVVVCLTPSEQGVGMKTARAGDRHDREFLASTDDRFRPVNFANGPDGCLYVVAMYREIIEDETAIPNDILEHYDLFSGRNLGRIYRVAPAQFERPTMPRLGSAGAAQLAEALASADEWTRETAQRLLYQRQDAGAVPMLRKLADEAERPQSRIHALWTLEGLDALDEPTLAAALADRDGHVREQAVGLAANEARRSKRIESKLVALADDPSPRVRLKVAFALGRVPDDAAAIPALARIARQDEGDAWIASAVAAAVPRRAGQLFSTLIADGEFLRRDGHEHLLGLLAQVVGARHDAAEVSRLLSDLAGVSRTGDAAALLRQLAEGLARGGGGRSLAELLAQPDAAAHRAALAALFDRAAADAANAGRSEAERVEAIRLLAYRPYASAAPTLSALLDPREPSRIQLEAVRALSAHADPGVAAELLARWTTFGPAVRPDAVDALLRRPERLGPLLGAIAAGRFAPGALTPGQRDMLLKHADPAIRDRARALLGVNENADKRKLIDRYRAAILKLQGDAARGQAVFQNNCAICHRPEHGQRPGPNLAVLDDRSPDTLLISILDPNREVKPAFVNYVLLTRDGQTLSGVIGNETANSVTLRYPGGGEETVLRANIQQLRSTSQSLMPDGLEAAINPQQMADLLRYLQTMKD